MSNSDWIWMPHAGHFILGHQCRFKLNTYVKGVIVSTVGEYLPDSQVRKIKADCHGIKILGKGDEWDYNYFKTFGYEEIGFNRTYETMVFRAEPEIKTECCPYRSSVAGGELDFDAYNDPLSAYNGHLNMCEKWDAKNEAEKSEQES